MKPARSTTAIATALLLLSAPVASHACNNHEDVSMADESNSKRADGRRDGTEHGVTLAQADSTSSAHAAAGASATARASASASASSTASSKGDGECRAESSASASATGNGKHESDHDSARETSRNGDCAARAESSASAGTGDFTYTDDGRESNARDDDHPDRSPPGS